MLCPVTDTPHTEHRWRSREHSRFYWCEGVPGAPMRAGVEVDSERVARELEYGFVPARSDAPDTVNHPAHYGGDTTYEAIKVINAWGLGFELGSALKYLCRAEHKGAPIEDLKKAVWYIQHEIDRREAQP